MDFDFLELAKSVIPMAGPDAGMMQAVLQSAAGSVPVITALSFEDNRMRFQARVPSALIQMFTMIGSRSAMQIPAGR